LNYNGREQNAAKLLRFNSRSYVAAKSVNETEQSVVVPEGEIVRLNGALVGAFQDGPLAVGKASPVAPERNDLGSMQITSGLVGLSRCNALL